MRLCLPYILGIMIGFCADPIPPSKTFPDWPLAPVPTVPVQPTPSPVSILAGEYLYVVQSDEVVQLLSSPPGIVDIQEDAGPIKIRGKFVDGSGKTETRTYTKKQVFVVTRLQQGDVELLMTPKGAVTRRMLVDTDPIPPPKPKPPTPVDPPVPAKTFHVFFVYESTGGKANLTPEQHGVIFGNVVENFLVKNCTGGAAGFRRRDKDSPPGTGDMGALWTAVKPSFTTFPCAVVEKNDKAEIIPVEATPELMVAKFNEYLLGSK